MRYLISAAVAAIVSAGAAQAATVDLTYTLQTQLRSIVQNFDTPYELPLDQEVGDIVTEVFEVSLDTDADFPQRIERPFVFDTIHAFDSETGAINYNTWIAQEMTRNYDLESDGTGTFFLSGIFGPGYVDYTYDVLGYEVSGLADVAPVPLPASLPLLLVGLGAAGMISRKRII